MQTHSTKQALSAALALSRQRSRTIGLVPTMGALHQGHASLMRRARAECDVVVATIFVNPLQFAPAEDFERYPRTFDVDQALAAEAGVDHLFAPTVSEMYPAGSLATRVEVGPIGEVGEGAWRPGFFSGVATVCVKLFSIARPDRAYFGEKDAQQLAVIRQVVTDMDLGIEVVGCPTVREPDGLAVSSRNAYLDGAERRVAPALAQALFAARDAARAGEEDAGKLRWLVERSLEEERGIRLQYVNVFDPATFQPREQVGGRAILAAAAFVGTTRLIDNVELISAAIPAGGSRP